jgi:hypothetical protein
MRSPQCGQGIRPSAVTAGRGDSGSDGGGVGAGPVVMGAGVADAAGPSAAPAARIRPQSWHFTSPAGWSAGWHSRPQDGQVSGVLMALLPAACHLG